MSQEIADAINELIVRGLVKLTWVEEIGDIAYRPTEKGRELYPDLMEAYDTAKEVLLHEPD